MAYQVRLTIRLAYRRPFDSRSWPYVPKRCRFRAIRLPEIRMACRTLYDKPYVKWVAISTPEVVDR